MATNLINQVTVMNSLHNLMGYRNSPGGTDDDFKRYIQESFDYCWRYYRWRWALKTGATTDDGVLPDDFDLDGYYSNAASANVIWDSDLQKLRFDPAIAVPAFTYQMAPPTLGTDSYVPFPSSQVVALGASIYAKMGANPTRAEVQQEWDMFHAELDRLVGRADRNQPRRPQNYHDVMGTFTGDVG